MAANDTAFVLATTKPVSLFWKCWPIVMPLQSHKACF